LSPGAQGESLSREGKDAQHNREDDGGPGAI
jgi:hypothetical protein